MNKAFKNISLDSVTQIALRKLLENNNLLPKIDMVPNLIKVSFEPVYLCEDDFVLASHNTTQEAPMPTRDASETIGYFCPSCYCSVQGDAVKCHNCLHSFVKEEAWKLATYPDHLSPKNKQTN